MDCFKSKFGSNNYENSEKFAVSTNSWEVKGLRKYQKYAFQAGSIVFSRESDSRISIVLGGCGYVQNDDVVMSVCNQWLKMTYLTAYDI